MSDQSILTLISILVTAVLSLLSITQVIISKCFEIKAKTKELNTSVFFTHYYNAINDFASQFANYHDHSTHKKEFLSAIFKVMIFCSNPLQEKLQSLAESVIAQSTTTPNYESSDKIFYDCLSALKEEFCLQKLPNK